MFFSLFTKECRQLLSSLVFYIYIVIFVLFMASQLGNVNAVTMPQPGQESYGTEYTIDETAIMEQTLSTLFREVSNESFDTYPLGFIKTFIPGHDDLEKITDILERCTGYSLNELTDMDLKFYEASGNFLDYDFTVPLANDLDYDTFVSEMAKVADIVGSGCLYEKDMFETFTLAPVTYEQAVKEFNDICDIDHVTDSYMRLFCDYAEIMLGLLPIFVMVTRCVRDRRSHAMQVIFSKPSSSARIVLSRYLANLAMVLIPVLILAFAMELPYVYQAHTLGVTPHYLSFIKYTFVWLLPVTAWIMALSYLLAELTNGIVAVIVPVLYTFFCDLSGNVLVGDWGFKLMPRWNTFGEAEYFMQHQNELYVNRLFYGGLAVCAVMLTVFIYNCKRKGGLMRRGKAL